MDSLACYRILLYGSDLDMRPCRGQWVNGAPNLPIEEGSVRSVGGSGKRPERDFIASGLTKAIIVVWFCPRVIGMHKLEPLVVY